jgi:hypothetical protein
MCLPMSFIGWVMISRRGQLDNHKAKHESPTESWLETMASMVSISETRNNEKLISSWVE